MSRLFRLIEAITHWLKRVVTQPLSELDRWQRAVRSAYDLGRFGATQLQHDRATEMAAALAFRTLFGLLPVMVVCTILVRAMGMQQNFLGPLDWMLEFWELDTVQIVAPNEAGGHSTTLDLWLRDRINEAEKINVPAIGWVGFGVTLYAAISLVVTIEDCFNLIYRAPVGRPWTRRVPMYWFVLTISPVALVASSYVDGYIRRLMVALPAQRYLEPIIGVAWSVFAIWLVMLAVYVLMPNTAVRIRSAAIGALVAAVLLEIGKRTMGVYLQNTLSISNLYGSLGLIPLFMFWVYLMWLAVLFGLQVSSTLQHLRGRQLAEWKQQRWETALADPAIVIVMMRHVGERFLSGRTTTIDDLTKISGLPEPAVEKIVARLSDGGLLHRVADTESSLALSRPPADIPLARLLEIAFAAFQHGEAANSSHTQPEPLHSLRQAQLATTAGQSLQSLLDSSS